MTSAGTTSETTSESRLHLVCPACGATNRLAAARLADEPVCGQCGHALMAPRPVALSDATFAKFVEHTDLPVLVDFWAEWCGPCRMMAPQFEQAAARLPRVRFAKVDTEASPQTSVRYRIRSIPTLILFERGQEVARRLGATSAADLQAWVQAHAGARRA